MADPVGSTSWHNRHLSAFLRLDELLRAAMIDRPTVIDIGPGGVTTCAAWLLNDAARTQAGAIRKWIGDAARYGDQLLRRVPFMPLTTLEPLELHRTLSMPHRLVVVDRSRRVLEAVANRLPVAECHSLDIAVARPPVDADAVVAFNVVCRLQDPMTGMMNVTAAVRPGGWLLVDDRSAQTCRAALADFEPTAEKIHRRRG